MRLHKKGELGLHTLPSLALGVLVFAIIVVISMVILSSLQRNTVFATNTNNESFTVPATNSTVTLGHSTILQIYNVTNQSGLFSIGAGNYTFNTTTAVSGAVQWLANSTICNQTGTCYASYQWVNESSSTTITSMITAIRELPNNWLLLIMVVLAASVIIGIVLTSIGGLGGGKGRS
jgi:hypothetical protein